MYRSFFICHHQSSGGNQARILYDQLCSLGCKVWYDNEQPATERNVDGMRRGVKRSQTLLIFLSGRKETDGEADKNGNYEGPFTRWFCHEEMATARKHGLTVVGVKEEDPRFGKPDFEQERHRGMNGGRDGGPVHELAAENLELLNTCCFISRRTQKHEIPGYLAEVVNQGIELAAQKARDEEFISSRVWADLFLPPGKASHICICNQQASTVTGNQAEALRQKLVAMGCQVQYPQPGEGMTPEILQRIVTQCSCLLLYLGGGRQSDGSYAGVFASDFCQQQMKIAQLAELPVIGVMEAGFGDFMDEKRTCFEGEGNATNLALLDTVCFIPSRSQQHEVQGFLDEVVSQWTEKTRHQRKA